MKLKISPFTALLLLAPMGAFTIEMPPALAECNPFGCSQSSVAECNPFGCPNPPLGAACNPFGCPPSPQANTEPPRRPGRRENRSSQVDTFSIRNQCDRPINITVEYRPMGSDNFVTSNHFLRPGQVEQVAQTTNRYVYVSGSSRNGRFNWQRQQIDMGSQLGVEHTQSFTCGS